MRGIWEAWRWTVQEAQGAVLVNLPFSCEHPAARVSAWRPEDGGYEVAALKPGVFLLRPPAWVPKEGVSLERNGRQETVNWGGPTNAYAVCRDVAEADVLRLNWPVPLFRQTFVPTSVEGHTESISFDWCGNQVQRVTPRGRHLPMFG